MRPDVPAINDETGELVMHRDMIETTSSWLPTIDKSWRYTDGQGHEHYWRDGYPTLRTVVESVETWWCGDCRDEHTDEHSHMECVDCGEVIKPGMRLPSLFREFAPGRTSYLLDGVPISEERARQIISRRTQR